MLVAGGQPNASKIGDKKPRLQIASRDHRDRLVGALAVQTCELGPVDGFDDDEAEGESDESAEVLVGFLATQGDALEALELADQLLDAGARPVERLRKESWPVLGRGFERDHRADAPLTRCRAIALAVVSFVTHRSAGRDVGPK